MQLSDSLPLLQEAVEAFDLPMHGTRSLANSNVTCEFSPGSNAFSHVCFNYDSPISVDPSLPELTPVQGCFTNNITDSKTSRTNGECGSLCLISSPVDGADGSSLCAYCAFLENGDFVYDCTNLFPEAACPARDSRGNCTEGFEQWSCSRNPEFGRGYSCVMSNLPNPALLFDGISQSDITTYLVCANDNTGLDVTTCQQPLCGIINATEEAQFCSGCDIVKENIVSNAGPLFEYDCLDAFPDLSCPILLPNGTCYNKTLESFPVKENTTLWNVASMIFEKDLDQNDSEEGWTLSNVDPVVFNVVMDLFDRIVMTMLGMVIPLLFPLLLSWQMQRQKIGAVPASTLGSPPSDFWGACSAVFAWKGLSFPVALFLLFLFITEIAHSMADLNLSFVSIQEEGPNMTILQLGAKASQRNPFPPLEIVGDPLSFRTRITNKYLSEGDYEASRPQTNMVNRYLGAVRSIAAGHSPFIKRNRTSWRLVDLEYYANAYAGDFLFLSSSVDYDASPLTEMDLEIPINCYDTEMAKSERIREGNLDFDEPQESIAWVPNCTLTNERSTGIYDGQRLQSPRIVEVLEIVGSSELLLSDSYRKANILLKNGNESFVSFQASPQSKALARDRNTIKTIERGRRFFDIDGMDIGNMSISFPSVFLATGPPVSTLGRSAGGTFIERSEYALVAEIDSTCPDRPSGLKSGDEECLVLISLFCDSFPEDYAFIVHDVYGPEPESSACNFYSARIVWGRNFEADAELVATVAGMYGLVQPSVVRGQLREFVLDGILASLFALGQVKEAPSIALVVRARINLSFIIFMSLPLTLALLLMVLVVWMNRNLSLPVMPTNPWEMMVIGAENELLIPKRQDKDSSFPVEDPEIVLTTVMDPQKRGRSSRLGLSRTVSSHSSNPPGQPTTSQVPPCGGSSIGSNSMASSDQSTSV